MWLVLHTSTHTAVTGAASRVETDNLCGISESLWLSSSSMFIGHLRPHCIVGAGWKEMHICNWKTHTPRIREKAIRILSTVWLCAAAPSESLIRRERALLYYAPLRSRVEETETAVMYCDSHWKQKICVQHKIKTLQKRKRKTCGRNGKQITYYH